MKKFSVYVILPVLAAALIFCACGKASAPAEITDKQSAVPAQELTVQPTLEPTPEPTPEPVYQPMEVYRDVLSLWKTAVNETWDFETLENNGLNYMAYYCYSNAPADRLGYQISDLDGDGSEELLVGSITGDDYQDKIVLQLYTMENGEAKLVFNSGERDRYYLCSDGTIANEGSSSAYETSYNYYSYSSGELQLMGSVLFNMSLNREQPWYFVLGENRTNVDEATANAKIAEYQAVYTTPQYTPFAQYQ